MRSDIKGILFALRKTSEVSYFEDMFFAGNYSDKFDAFSTVKLHMSNVLKVSENNFRAFYVGILSWN